MSTDLMPNRYTPGETDLPEREAELIARRDEVLGASYRLQYRRPVHFVRGEGMWLYDPDGRAYLDFYNNVPSLGHCHPEVNAAMAEQAGRVGAIRAISSPGLSNMRNDWLRPFPARSTGWSSHARGANPTIWPCGSPDMQAVTKA